MYTVCVHTVNSLCILSTIMGKEDRGWLQQHHFHQEQMTSQLCHQFYAWPLSSWDCMWHFTAVWRKATSISSYNTSQPTHSRTNTHPERERLLAVVCHIASVCWTALCVWSCEYALTAGDTTYDSVVSAAHESVIRDRFSVLSPERAAYFALVTCFYGTGVCCLCLFLLSVKWRPADLTVLHQMLHLRMIQRKNMGNVLPAETVENIFFKTSR